MADIPPNEQAHYDLVTRAQAAAIIGCTTDAIYVAEKAGKIMRAARAAHGMALDGRGQPPVLYHREDVITLKALLQGGPTPGHLLPPVVYYYRALNYLAVCSRIEPARVAAHLNEVERGTSEFPTPYVWRLVTRFDVVGDEIIPSKKVVFTACDDYEDRIHISFERMNEGRAAPR